MKYVLFVLAALGLVAAYAAGRWPERERRLVLEGEVAVLQGRLQDAEERVRMDALLAELQNLMEVVGQKNYGEAQTLSSRFFDRTRAESGRTSQAGFKAALDAVLGLRDGVTAALAQADPAVSQRLRLADRRLRDALGYRPTSAPPAAPPAAAAPGEGPAAPSPPA